MKYFGTDGIRGLANKKITPELSLKVGLGIGELLTNKEQKKVVIGNDSRISSQMIENAISAGLLSKGVDVYRVGVLPTPAISHIVQENNFDFGIMISASHNPFGDNGIKIFGPDGLKIIGEQELEIENTIDNDEKQERPLNEELGQEYIATELVKGYKDNLINSIKVGKKLKVALDLANGATSNVAKEIFEQAGCEVITIGDTPNNININDKVGSTYPKTLSEFMANQGGFDLGFAFDGDGDRVIAFDNNGNILDGDYILYLLGKAYANNGKLENNTVVATVMANLGFMKAMEELNINVDVVSVGDKYVMESMFTNNFNLGGEQSGHIIIKHLGKTGDGILAALQIVEVVSNATESVTQLTAGMEKFPQTLINVKVNDKTKVMESKDLNDEIAQVEKVLEGNGRVLVRASGTEELVRVMVEAKTQEQADDSANKIVNYIKANY